MGGGQTARSVGGASFRTARDVLAGGGRRRPARELDVAAAAGPERRDPVPDCERTGRDRPARDGEDAAQERGPLSRGGGEQPGLCLHLLDGGPADLVECVYGRDAGLSRRGAGGAHGDGADGRRGRGGVPGLPEYAGERGRVAGRVAACGAATACTGASRCAAGACNCRASGRSC